MRQLGEPVLELLEEAVLGMSCLQVEESQHQRSGQAEQRRAEGGAHSGQGSLQIIAQPTEHLSHVAARYLQARDDLARCDHGIEKTPECPEEPEKDQQADDIARYVPVLIEAQPDAVEQGAHRGSGQARRARPAGKQPRKRCKHPGLPAVERRNSGLPSAQPYAFVLQAEDLLEDDADARCQNADDHPVEQRVRHEGGAQLREEQGHDHEDRKQKHQHPQVRSILHGLTSLPCPRELLKKRGNKRDTAPDSKAQGPVASRDGTPSCNPLIPPDNQRMRIAPRLLSRDEPPIGSCPTSGEPAGGYTPASN